jgi:hypothetical protein
MSAEATVTVSVLATLIKSLDLAAGTVPLTYTQQKAFTDGAGADKIEAIFHDQRTLSASANEDLDLAGGLTDGFGDTITFTKVKAILVKAAAGNTNDVVVGGASATQWAAPFGDVSDKVNVKPGGLFLLTAPDATGLAVVAGTGDLLRIANSAGSTTVTYDIIILGEVA